MNRFGAPFIQPASGPDKNADGSTSLCRFHPEIAKPADKLPTDRSCTERVVSVAQILFANLTVASCILTALWLHLCGGLHHSELSLDLAKG